MHKGKLSSKCKGSKLVFLRKKHRMNFCCFSLFIFSALGIMFCSFPILTSLGLIPPTAALIYGCCALRIAFCLLPLKM